MQTVRFERVCRKCVTKWFSHRIGPESDAVSCDCDSKDSSQGVSKKKSAACDRRGNAVLEGTFHWKDSSPDLRCVWKSPSHRRLTPTSGKDFFFFLSFSFSPLHALAVIPHVFQEVRVRPPESGGLLQVSSPGGSVGFLAFGRDAALRSNTKVVD